MSKVFTKIPATVITGFLGAGKTTLVKHLMETAHGRRIALIVNEFGDVGVDGDLLASCGLPDCPQEDIIELANGCLCCTVADEFLPTMEKLISRENPPDHIVIETSGLALPKPLVKAFDWPDIRSKVTVDGVIAVVDAAAVAAGRFASTPEQMAQPDHDNPLEEVFEDQLACADMVVLNKVDLLPQGGLEAAEDALRGSLRSGVRVVRTQQGAVPSAVLLGLGAAVEDDLHSRPSHHDGEDDHDHEDFESFALELPALADPDAFEARLVQVIGQHDILRLKGFLAVEGKPMRQVVQAVGARITRYFDRPWKGSESRTSRLVVIGLHGLDKDAIAAALRG